MKSETYSLIFEIGTYCLYVWYTVLRKVNIVSKSIQSPTINLDTYATLLNGIIKFTDEYRITGFDKAKFMQKNLQSFWRVKHNLKFHNIEKILFEYEGNTIYI